jgi:hypothetical protein
LQQQQQQRAHQQQQQQQQQLQPPYQLSRQHSKFVRATDLPDDELLTIQVSLKKEDYGELGSSDYRKNRAMATQPLAEKFGVARHKLVTDAEDGDQSKYSHVQVVIVQVLHRIKQAEARAKAVDWMDICTIPFLIDGNLNNPDCTTWWDSSEINLFEDWDLLKLNQVRRWQFTINKRFSDGDRIASNWLYTFMSDSCTESLRTAVNKKYEQVHVSQQGGVLYAYMVLCEMFQMSREVEEAMHRFLEIFKRTGVAKFTGENLLVVQEQLIGICKRLDSVGALRAEHVMDVLSGLIICSTVKFRDLFKHLKQTAELNHLSLLLPIPADASPFEQIEGILEKAVDQYDLMCVAGQWNNVKSSRAALNSVVDNVGECWNCGQKGHRAGDCKKPKDPVTYNKNRKAFMEKKKTGSHSQGNGGGSGSGKPEKGTPEYHRKQWEANACSMVDGVLYINCKTCGLNTSHGTRQHESFAKNPSSFKLSSSHFYVKECTRLSQGYSGAFKTTGSTAPPPAAPPNTGSSILTIERSRLESALSDYERTSTNPNASELSEMMRSLFSLNS